MIDTVEKSLDKIVECNAVTELRQSRSRVIKRNAKLVKKNNLEDDKEYTVVRRSARIGQIKSEKYV